jgi:hypothetical protein
MTVEFPSETVRWCVEITIIHLQPQDRISQFRLSAEKLLKVNQINPETHCDIYT